MSEQRLPGTSSSLPRSWTRQLISQSADVLVGRGLGEEGALERDVVAGDHREAVERLRMSPLSIRRRGDRVVGAVGVEAGLEPGPGVHQLGVRPGRGRSRAPCVAVECSATSCSGAPTAIASTQAAPPMSAMRRHLGDVARSPRPT